LVVQRCAPSPSAAEIATPATAAAARGAWTGSGRAAGVGCPLIGTPGKGGATNIRRSDPSMCRWASSPAASAGSSPSRASNAVRSGPPSRPSRYASSDDIAALPFPSAASP
jgi:hypothetical protein